MSEEKKLQEPSAKVEPEMETCENCDGEGGFDGTDGDACNDCNGTGKRAKRIPVPAAPTEAENYVAWLKFVTTKGDNTAIRLAASNDPGAFKVYRHPPRLPLPPRWSRGGVSKFLCQCYQVWRAMDRSMSAHIRSGDGAVA